MGYGESVIAPLAYFMTDQDEDIWIRRHVPSTLALIPSAASVTALLKALDDPDGFLRFKAISALDRLRQSNTEIEIDPEIATRQVNVEAARAFNALTLHYNLFVAGGLDKASLLSRALKEKQARALNRTFQLLGLIHTPGDVAAVRHTLRVGDDRARSRAIEYLDNLLKGDVRRRVMLLVEEMPLDERIRKGNVIYRTRTRDVEDTVAQLLHDEDQSIASAAVLLVEERGLWKLADDLEHVLAHRDARDQHVFEAASWALAAHRMPSERRKELWQEPLPTVELADRLRRIPLFDFTHVDELFRLARLGEQVRHEPGRMLYSRGATPATLQFLIDGRVRATSSAESTEIAAPAPLAFEEILEGSPMTASVSTAERSVTLALKTDEFLALLSENVELAEGIFRLLIHTHQLGAGHTLIRGTLAPEFTQEQTPSRRSLGDGGSLRPVDRLLLLQGSPLLANATAAQLWRLSVIAKPVDLAVNAEPLKRNDESAILIVLSGTLSVEMADGTVGTATAGDVIGMYETLGGSKFDATVKVTTPATVLRLDRGSLFELLADHTDLLQSLFSTLLRRRSESAHLVNA